MTTNELMAKYKINCLFVNINTWLTHYNNINLEEKPRIHLMYDTYSKCALVVKLKLNGDFLVRKYDNVVFDTEEAD